MMTEAFIIITHFLLLCQILDNYIRRIRQEKGETVGYLCQSSLTISPFLPSGILVPPEAPTGSETGPAELTLACFDVSRLAFTPGVVVVVVNWFIPSMLSS